jgi:hypothetical protein
LGSDDRGIAVVAGWVEDDERREPVDMPLECKALRHGLCRHGSDLAADEVEDKIVPTG